jgi:hypothetical protein
MHTFYKLINLRSTLVTEVKSLILKIKKGSFVKIINEANLDAQN